MAEQPPKQRRKLAAILMADVSGFSRMMGSDEEGMTVRIRDFHARTKAIVDDHEGRVVDTAGDSVFGEFDSVVNAMRCAQEIQRAQAQKNRGQPRSKRIDTRIGVHVGDVIVEEYQIYGDGVNIAARLEAIAEPGGICVSEAVFQQVRNKMPVEFEDMGVKELKNIEFPVRLYRVPPESYLGSDNTPPPPSGDTSQSEMEDRHPADSIKDELFETKNLVKLGVAGFLLLCPIFLVESAGVFPLAGVIIIARVIVWPWAKYYDMPGNLRIATGVALMLGAPITHWSTATDIIFAFAGAILISKGYNQNKKHKRRR